MTPVLSSLSHQHIHDRAQFSPKASPTTNNGPTTEHCDGPGAAKSEPSSRLKLRKKRTPSIAFQLCHDLLNDLDKKERETTAKMEARLEALRKAEESISKHLEHHTRVSQETFKPSLFVAKSVDSGLSLKEDYSEMYEKEFEDGDFLSKPSPSSTAKADRTDTIVTLHGSPNADIPPSNVKCGGCGATFHCRDPAVPGLFIILKFGCQFANGNTIYGLVGFIASEIFLLLSEEDLSSRECQRCKLLKEHNMALNVAMTPQDYALILQKVKKKKVITATYEELYFFH